ETPGKHKLILDMDVPVVSPEGRGTDRGFELGLPHAAITLLEQLDLSDQVAELRIAGRTASIPAKWLDSKSANRQKVALGPLDRLEISWKGRAPQQQADPLLTALGQVKVEIEDAQITTEANLTLQSRRGAAAEWRLQLPPQTRPQDVR